MMGALDRRAIFISLLVAGLLATAATWAAKQPRPKCSN